MEAAYIAQRNTDVRQVSKLWCVVQLVLCVMWFLLTPIKYGLFRRPSLEAFLPEPLPFIAIAAVFISNYVACWRRYTHVLMYTGSLVIIGFLMWKVHFHVIQETLVAQAVTLKVVFGAMQGVDHVDALQQLKTYVNLEMSRKALIFSGVQILLLFNVLQFLGLDMGTATVYLSFPTALIMTAFISPIVANTVPEVAVLSSAIAVVAILSSFQVSRLQRQRFATDHALQLTLEREAETSQRLADHERRTREAAIEADNILNHMLKNIMADAAGLIWLFAATLQMAMPSDLEQALSCLDRGMRWCRRRQALVRITAKAYHPARMPVDLRAFGEALTNGRAVDCQFVDGVVLLDPLLCDILLDNAINNALRHGDTTQEPVAFRMEMRSLAEDEAELRFVVRNRAKPSRPRLTPEFVESVLRGEVGSEPGNGLSDHLGLQHLFLAAEVHDIHLSLQQEGDVVLLQATLTVQRGNRVETPSVSNLKPDADLCDLRILCLDDSEVARRLLLHTLSRELSSCTVEVFGSNAQEVEFFLEAALDRGDMIILDNHLVYEDAQFLGPELLRQLAHRGFSGFACVRSANMSPEDQAQYVASGAHYCIGKDIRPQEMVAALRTAYQEFRRSTLVQDSSSSSWSSLSLDQRHW
eukprot:GGOE01024700.1.p1 GENE.GGOE01024700.1~~GGOE01024700.1.p1  ORF type:complete len:667 (-),score=195.69 GGOE01024700.1:238-2157(-)